jgi:hydroxymethylpyrimidine pyrophosphatase-like HAD family hydrolase
VTFVEKLNVTAFSMIVFDYDGTLSCSDKSNRFSNQLENRVRDAIEAILKNNIKVAIVTGRGKSIIEILKNSINKSLHNLVTVGLYNGMIFNELSKIENLESLENAPLDNHLQELKHELERLNPFPLRKEMEGRRDQLIIETDYPQEVYEICKEIINDKGFADLNIWLSSHSMDVVVRANVSKRNVKNYHNGAILCIGDCGMVEGNDFEMLSTTYSLSVDRVSRAPETCWNIAPDGVRGVDATLYYLKNMTIADGIFKCQFKI